MSKRKRDHGLSTNDHYIQDERDSKRLCIESGNENPAEKNDLTMMFGERVSNMQPIDALFPDIFFNSANNRNVPPPPQRQQQFLLVSNPQTPVVNQRGFSSMNVVMDMEDDSNMMHKQTVSSHGHGFSRGTSNYNMRPNSTSFSSNNLPNSRVLTQTRRVRTHREIIDRTTFQLEENQSRNQLVMMKTLFPRYKRCTLFSDGGHSNNGTTTIRAKLTGYKKSNSKFKICKTQNVVTKNWYECVELHACREKRIEKKKKKKEDGDDDQMRRRTKPKNPKEENRKYYIPEFQFSKPITDVFERKEIQSNTRIENYYLHNRVEKKKVNNNRQQQHNKKRNNDPLFVPPPPLSGPHQEYVPMWEACRDGAKVQARHDHVTTYWKDPKTIAVRLVPKFDTRNKRNFFFSIFIVTKWKGVEYRSGCIFKRDMGGKYSKKVLLVGRVPEVRLDVYCEEL